MKINGLKIFGLCLLLALLAAALPSHAQETAPLTPKEIIAKAYKNLESQKSVFSEMIVTDETNKPNSIMTVAFLAPHSAHSVLIYEGKVFMEAIIIGSDEYEKFEGKWKKSKKTKFDELFDNVIKIIDVSDLKYMTNVEFAGKETLDGVETSVYRFEQDLKAMRRDIEAKFGGGAKLPEYFDEMKGKIWINAEGLPVKTENIRRTEETKTKIQTIKKTTVYRYDREIKIEAPRLAAGAGK